MNDQKETNPSETKKSFRQILLQKLLQWRSLQTRARLTLFYAGVIPAIIVAGIEFYLNIPSIALMLGSVAFLLIWPTITLTVTCRQTGAKLALYCGGLVAYAMLFWIFALYVGHHSHPVYPNPWALWMVIGAVAPTVLFFFLWPLACFRFQKNGSI